MGSHSEKHDQTILNKGGEEVCMSIEAWSCNLIKQHVIPITRHMLRNSITPKTHTEHRRTTSTAPTFQGEILWGRLPNCLKQGHVMKTAAQREAISSQRASNRFPRDR